MAKPTSWQTSLTELLRTHNSVRSNSPKATSHLTQEKRGDILFAGFRELRALGFRLDDVHQFKGKHMNALAKAWLERDLQPSTLQNNFSAFRALSIWIEKKGMVESTEHYVGKEKSQRTSINKVDRSWAAKSIDFPKKIEEVRNLDPHVAIQLEMQSAFGMRPAESMLFRPHLGDRGTHIAINWGCKNGRHRMMDITTPEQREVLNRAKASTTLNGSLCDPQLTYKQAYGKYYRIVAKAGITKEMLGVTSYGLRHGKSSDRYREITGVDSPVRGGGPVDPELDRYARQALAFDLGHSREHITTNYIGRFSPKN